jgi:lipopolysaccharide assembly protein A
MIRTLRYVFLAILAVVLLTVALANRAPVALRLMPDGVGEFLGLGGTVEMPLFLIIFGGIVAGLLIGFVWEWFREAKYRSTSTNKTREVSRLERELAVLRDIKAEPADDVLALLDRPRKAG